jgi:predicted nucleotide-binding protein
MAKTKRQEDTQQEPPHLIIQKEKAKQLIDLQTEKGGAIRDSNINSEIELNLAEGSYSKWTSYNHELLVRMFSNGLIAKEYDWAGMYSMGASSFSTIARDIAKFKDTINQKINKLESIKERLELIPEQISNPDVTGYEKNNTPKGRSIFVVHGHNEGIKQATARFIEKIDLRPVILHEQPNGGRTIIEKFEGYSDVGFALVLLTADDRGYSTNEPETVEHRARQNVIMELGYFLGKLGRGNVCALYQNGVAIPSDYSGVLYIPLDDKGAWKLELAKEIRHAGIAVDFNKAIE